MLKMLRNPGIMACFVDICLYHPSEFLKYMCNKVEHYYLGTVGCYACGMVVVPVSRPFCFLYISLVSRMCPDTPSTDWGER